MDEIKDIFNLQFDLNKRKNLWFRDLEHLFTIDPAFISMLREATNRDNLHFYESNLDALISYAVQQLTEEIFSINQFIYISQEQQKEAENIYRQSWEAMKLSDNPEDILYHVHYPRLSDWLAKLYPTHFITALQRLARLNQIVCREYSPELQAKILQLNVKELLPPVLDIGCGKEGQLVRHLRKRGVQAFGFDRLMDSREPFLAQEDWFAYEYGNRRWGTIISNAALSNHVVFAGHNDRPLLDKYEKLLEMILNSLKPGSSFIYAPGIPEVEANMDSSDYLVEKHPISYGLYKTVITRIVQ